MYFKMLKYFGPLSFYKKVLIIAMPLGLQQLVTSCMGIVDSLMVAWIGQVSAVGTASQIETLCSSVSWAFAAGVGIFSVQFFGAKDYRNLKKSFGLSIILAVLCGLFWMGLATFFGREILGFYLNDDKVIYYSLQYLRIVKYSYIPLALEFAFSITYRNINQPKIPLIVGLVAMAIKVVANYILIFGLFGFPALGIQGAALGTCLAHGIGVSISFIYSWISKQVFIGSFKEMFALNLRFIKPIMKKTQTVVINELFFGFGSTLFIKAFGALGTTSMDAYYVGSKIAEVFNAFTNGFSNAIAAIVGMSLGSGEVKKAKQEGDYLLSLAFVLSSFCLVFVYGASKGLVGLFGLTDLMVVNEAILIVQVFAIKIALRFFVVIILSSLRAGGDSLMMTLLDSGLMWTVGIPLAFISVHILNLQSIALVFLICQLEQVLRVYFGLKRYQKGEWAVNLTTLVS